jgi:hypothetical protein
MIQNDPQMVQWSEIGQKGHLGSLKDIKSYLKLFIAILNRFGPFQPFWDFSDLFASYWAILYHLEPFQAISGHFGLFQTISGSFGSL